jgi:hypothetical protein
VPAVHQDDGQPLAQLGFLCMAWMTTEPDQIKLDYILPSERLRTTGHAKNYTVTTSQPDQADDRGEQCNGRKIHSYQLVIRTSGYKGVDVHVSLAWRATS